VTVLLVVGVCFNFLSVGCIHCQEEGGCEQNKGEQDKDPGHDTQVLATQPVEDPCPKNHEYRVHNQGDNPEIAEERGDQTDAGQYQVQLCGGTVLSKVELLHIHYQKIKRNC